MADHHWDAARGHDVEGLVDAALDDLPRIGCRTELTDRLLRLQGAFRTSHAYSMGGDHPRPPVWLPGRLGADVSWDEGVGALRIERILRGDPDDPDRRSPLVGPGPRAEVGDLVRTVGGQRVAADTPLDALLTHRGGTDVALGLERDGDALEVVVRARRDDRPIRYRDWVLDRRARTHVQSGGRVGYVHIPNMGPTGFADFHRDYLTESERDALLVDVRFNTGGHVGQLLLQSLSRPMLGWVVPRWGAPYPYPAHGPRGPLACVTNEHAGSDGDIFCHAWMRMGLGPLFGHQTWGGTVGIVARHYLIDGSLITQPEYATWFDDVGFALENRGALPDHPVPHPPGEEEDRALDEAVAWLVNALIRSPAPPTPG